MGKQNISIKALVSREGHNANLVQFSKPFKNFPGPRSSLEDVNHKDKNNISSSKDDAIKFI